MQRLQSRPAFRFTCAALIGSLWLATPAMGARSTPQQQTPAGSGISLGQLPCRAAMPLPPPDPSDAQDFDCYYFGTYNWNDGTAGTVTGRVYWPSICGDGTTDPPAGTTLPLVLLMHGDGHNYTDYNYLLGHLARNGFIVASISNSGTNDARSDQALTFLNFLTNSWSRKDFIAIDNVGLIGHSRGGEAALTLARRINSQSLPYGVRSVISLAPTDSQEGGGIPETLSGDSSHALLVIYGTHDEDVHGYCLSGGLPECGVLPLSARSSGYALYDRAGWEGETEPFPLSSQVVDKALVYIKGANHNGWRSTCFNPGPGNLSCNTHHQLAKGYMNAWLRWQHFDEDIYRNYFSGEMKLPIVNEQTLQVQKSFQAGNGRRVIDNFEQAGWGTNSLGGFVSKEATVVVIKEGTTWDYDPTSPHDTNSLVIGWAPPGLAPWMRFGIPDGETGGFASRRYRDINDHEFLSLRAGQVYGSSLNSVDISKDFYVQLRDPFGGTTPLIRVSDYADLPYPTVANVWQTQQSLTVATSPMNTIRIPTCRFTGVNKENISSVWFFFTVPGSTRGEILLDNIEFTD